MKPQNYCRHNYGLSWNSTLPKWSLGHALPYKLLDRPNAHLLLELCFYIVPSLDMLDYFETWVLNQINRLYRQLLAITMGLDVKSAQFSKLLHSTGFVESLSFCASLPLQLSIYQTLPLWTWRNTCLGVIIILIHPRERNIQVCYMNESEEKFRV